MAAFWDDRHVYLVFTDTTAPGSNKLNGGSTYVLRSTDAFFLQNVEELTADGFVPVTSANASRREHSIADASSVDVALVPEVNQIVMAINGKPGTTTFRFFDRDFRSLQTDVEMPDVNWAEGAGLIRTGSGALLQHGSGSADLRSLITYQPIGFGLSPWEWELECHAVDIRLTNDRVQRVSFERDEELPAIQQGGQEEPVATIVEDRNAATDGARYLSMRHIRDESFTRMPIYLEVPARDVTISFDVRFRSPFDHPGSIKFNRSGHELEDGSGLGFQMVTQSSASDDPNMSGLNRGSYLTHAGRRDRRHKSNISPLLLARS